MGCTLQTLDVEGVGRCNCEAPLSNFWPVTATVGTAQKLEKANVIPIFQKGKSPLLSFPGTLDVVNFLAE